MKFTIDVDCTPEEARLFLGLPDVAPLQERMLQELEQKMKEGMETFDAEQLMKQWMTPGLDGSGMEGLNKLTQAFWSQMGAGFPAGDKKNKE